MSDTPETDELARSLLYERLASTETCYYEMRMLARQLERDRDEWKAKYIQQNKDLGCEMMDPNGTIWDHAKKLQDENKALQEQLDAAIMLGKIQERRHARELEQVREQYRLSSVCRQLKEENDKLKQQ